MRAIFRGAFDTCAATWNFYVQAGLRQGVDAGGAGGAAQFCGWGVLVLGAPKGYSRYSASVQSHCCRGRCVES